MSAGQLTVPVSNEFKKQTKRAIAAIVLFIVVYIVLMTAAVGLFAASVVIGLYLISQMPHFITIIIGGGLISFGVLILVFLFKFIFTRNKSDYSNLIEIHQQDQPTLFAMLHEMVQEVGTEFPKKVYITPEVNAAVFYNSSFLSMFLPVRKNLMIGLGLVNTTTALELKGILAHEFGHFSQRSMKVGSYVYQVNRVIYSMLFQNESLEVFAQKLSNLNNIFAFFVFMALRTVEGIQWVLRKLYNVVNINYNALSREMEFHADEIAAHLVGADPMKYALMRMDLTSFSYNQLMDFYDNRIDKNITTANVYPQMTRVVHFHGEHNELQKHHGLPQPSEADVTKFNRSKLHVKDQWASHPSVKERVIRMESLNLSSMVDDGTEAGTLFVDYERLQETMTTQMFNQVTYSGQPVAISSDEFYIEWQKELSEISFDPFFNDYFDKRMPILTDEKEITVDNPKAFLLNEAFSDSVLDTLYELQGIESDVESIRFMLENKTGIRTFDYDGKRYDLKTCKPLFEKLEKEFESQDEKMTAHDHRIYWAFKQLASDIGNQARLNSFIKNVVNAIELAQSNTDLYNTLSERLEFVQERTDIDMISANFISLRTQEKKLKEALKSLLEDAALKESVSEELKSELVTFLRNDLKYFKSDGYLEDNLQLLYLSMNVMLQLSENKVYWEKKRLLDHQVSLLTPIPA